MKTMLNYDIKVNNGNGVLVFTYGASTDDGCHTTAEFLATFKHGLKTMERTLDFNLGEEFKKILVRDFTDDTTDCFVKPLPFNHTLSLDKCYE